jgi:hypothetical protein
MTLIVKNSGKTFVKHKVIVKNKGKTFVNHNVIFLKSVYH